MLKSIKRLTLFLRHRIPALISSLPYFILGLPKDIPIIVSFLFNGNLPGVGFFQRFYLIARFYLISLSVHCLHRQSEILQVVSSILSIPPDSEGCVVEAGCYKGGSAAKFSLACKIAGREFFVFDSFEGFPEDPEFQDRLSRHIHKGDHAQDLYFSKNALRGTFNEVTDNIKRFGSIDSCKFVRGWFKDTMPEFNKKISVMYLDVDLVSSAKTCLKYLYPLLKEDGVLFSHDGIFPSIVNVFDNDQFWKDEAGVTKPPIIGLKKEKLIKIIKPLKA